MKNELGRHQVVRKNLLFQQGVYMNPQGCRCFWEKDHLYVCIFLSRSYESPCLLPPSRRPFGILGSAWSRRKRKKEENNVLYKRNRHFLDANKFFLIIVLIMLTDVVNSCIFLQLITNYDLKSRAQVYKKFMQLIKISIWTRD